MEHAQDLKTLMEGLMDNWPVFRAVAAVVIGGCITGLLYNRASPEAKARDRENGDLALGTLLVGFIVGAVVYAFMHIVLIAFFVVVGLICGCRILPILSGNIFHAKRQMRGDFRGPELSAEEQQLLIQLALRHSFQQMQPRLTHTIDPDMPEDVQREQVEWMQNQS